MPIRVVGPTSDRHPPAKWDSPERRKKRQKEYMEKHGEPDKKRIQIRPKVSDRMQKLRDNLASVTGGEWGKKSGGRIGLKSGTSPKVHKQPLPPGYWKDRLKDVGKRYPRPRENLIEKLGGSEKAKPHSTKEGRVASGKRRIRRILARQGPEGGRPKPQPGPGGYDPPKWKRPERIMTPALRAKKGIGGKIIQKIVSKLKPKPKGVFKPKPVPKGVLDRPTGWSPKGSYTKADDKKITSMLKNLGDEIKAQPLPSKVKETIKKLQKAYPHKKAAGGRIKKGHGGSAAQQHYLQHGYGPHKIQLRSGKPKLAKKGW